MQDVQDALTRLTALVEGARAMPMSASCVVNRGEVLALLAQLRNGLPQALTDAERVLADRAGVLEQGRLAAEQIVAGAHDERRRVLASTDVLQEASAEAERLLEQARGEADAVRAEVDEYVDAKLATFEVVLGKTMAAVERGRSKLAGRSELDALRSPDPGPDDPPVG